MGPHKTVYNRFARWSERGIWQRISECAAAPSDPPEQAALDSSHVKAHRCAHSGKGGPINSGDRSHERRPQQQDPWILDEFCRPWAFVFTVGNTADCVMQEECVSLIPGVKELLANKGYDADAIRAFSKSAVS
jgi:hypothetical protein